MFDLNIWDTFGAHLAVYLFDNINYKKNEVIVKFEKLFKEPTTVQVLLWHNENIKFSRTFFKPGKH